MLAAASSEIRRSSDARIAASTFVTRSSSRRCGTAPGRSPSTAASLNIPPGHLPAPGMCRVWMPGEPPGHQPKPRSCSNIERTAPAGSYIVERPGKDKKVVHVRVMDERRPGVVLRMRVYEIRDGKLVRQG